jgi:hypothetical protein
MGRSESGSSAAVAAVLVIGGVMLLLVLGCGGFIAMGFLSYSRGMQVAQTVQVAPQASAQAYAEPARVITNSPDGQAMIDGQVYTDDELRALLAERPGDMDEAPIYVLELTADIDAERRAAIEQIVADIAITATPALDLAPAETVVPKE